MKSITLHNLDEELYRMISISAKQNHRSLNQEVKDKLSNFFFNKSSLDEPKSFIGFSGLWDDEDVLEFIEKTRDFEIISESDWNK